MITSLLVEKKKYKHSNEKEETVITQLFTKKVGT